MTNICRYCGKCIHCSHPYFDCPERNKPTKEDWNRIVELQEKTLQERKA